MLSSLIDVQNLTLWLSLSVYPDGKVCISILVSPALPLSFRSTLDEY